jgi:hypothetical protein
MAIEQPTDLDHPAITPSGTRSAIRDARTERQQSPRLRTPSSRLRDDGIPIGGFVGGLRVEGDLAPVWPLLCLGGIIHAGSGTALGLGRYDLLAGI